MVEPHLGLVEKMEYRVPFSLTPDVFLFFLELYLKIFGGFKETRYICSILQKYSNNDNNFIKEIIFARYGVESGNAPMLYYMA